MVRGTKEDVPLAAESPTNSTAPPASSGRLGETLLLGGVLLVCFLPRAWLCLEREAVCSDAVIYMRAADALERGDWDGALKHLNLNLNIYPPILVALRHTGIEWTRAGAWWSVVFSSLAVLPLLGLLRRMFDSRVAIISCLFYAAQPCLLAYSPLMLRDPTHWFLFLLGLYLIWRATAEARWSFFLAAGVVLTLAVHLRSEAWLLVLPLVGWAAWRWFQDASRRRRLLAGTLVCLAMVPATVVGVNLTVLADHPRWEWGYMRPVADARLWIKATLAPRRAEPDPPRPKQAKSRQVGGTLPEKVKGTPPTQQKMSTGMALCKVVVRMVKTLTYTYGLLALISLWIDRKELIGPRDLPLVLVCLVLLLGMAIRLTFNPIEPRYFLIIVLLALPRVARGAILASQAAASLLRRWCSVSVGAGRLLAGLIVLVLVGGMIAGWNTARLNAGDWNQQAALGRWIGTALGPKLRIAGNIDRYQLVVYYADGKNIHAPLAVRHDSRALTSTIKKERPDLIVLWEEGDLGRSRQAYLSILRDRKKLGYWTVRPDALPPSCHGIRLLVRQGLSGVDAESLLEPDATFCGKSSVSEDE